MRTGAGRANCSRSPSQDFLQRWLLHVPPPGFAVVRAYGLYAPGKRDSVDAVSPGARGQRRWSLRPPWTGRAMCPARAAASRVLPGVWPAVDPHSARSRPPARAVRWAWPRPVRWPRYRRPHDPEAYEELTTSSEILWTDVGMAGRLQCRAGRGVLRPQAARPPEAPHGQFPPHRDPTLPSGRAGAGQ